MARTKQTGRKSTGGRVPAADIPAKPSTQHPHIANVSPTVLPPNSPTAPATTGPLAKGSQTWCYICVDGGTLFACDKCCRVVCSAHLDLPSGNSVETALFVCPCCHLEAWGKAKSPYFGFYSPQSDLSQDPAKWTPFLSQALALKGDYQMTAKSQVLYTSIIIIHLVLSGIKTLGCPPLLMFHHLQAYLGDKVAYHEVSFDFGTLDSISLFEDRIDKVVEAFKTTEFERVVIFITDHSHDDTGDLFMRPGFCAPARDVLTALFPKKLYVYIVPKKPTMFILSCGALVREEESFQSLVYTASWLSLSQMVCFTAKELQSTLLVSFFADYTQRVLVESYPLEETLHTILSATAHTTIGRHTSIIYLRPKNVKIPLPVGAPVVEHKGLQATEYFFAHEKLRPWGVALPIACSKCFCPRPWSKPVKEKSNIIFFCRYKSCRNQIRFPARQGAQVYGGSLGSGKWMSVKRNI